MEQYATVADYLNNNPNSNAKLVQLRELLATTELEETVKWGAPCYTLNGKNVVGLAAFKTYVGLWFHQGVFLDDADKVLLNAQEGVTKGLRQWRFGANDEINHQQVLRYINEAIANAKAGREIKVEQKKLVIPEELEKALNGSSELQAAFDGFTPGKQREFANYVAEAKRAETRLKRLDKVVPMIMQGIGLNDKYR